MMENIVSEVSKLDDGALRKELIRAKIPIGPIVKSTRPIFEKKLVEYKAKQGGVWPDDAPDRATMDAPSEPSVRTPPVVGPQTSTPKRTTSDSYFVVCIPVLEPKPDDAVFMTPSKAVSHIFEDQKEALKLLKKNPGARFKVFRSRKDAESFAGLKENLSTPRSVEIERKTERKILGSKPTSDSPNEYSSPKSQQYVALRRALVGQDKETFNELVWNNPRYLITSGDTPTILQEGPRYNAVHICAQKDLVEMCSVVLDTLQNPDFIKLMYPGESDDTLKRRMAHIIDLYLNVPDKGNNETPLHFACKFGKVAMVKYLLEYPICDRSLKNRYGQTPAEIICSRCPKEETTKQKIQEALEPPEESEEFYVPVFRTEDNTSPPQIGQPWSPAASDSQSEQSYDSLRSPVDIDWNVKAFAGPMSPKDASCLYQKWKGRWKGKKDEDRDIQRSDDEKGLERIGRRLSQSAGVPWKEYWDFLDEFVDLSTREGMQKLERHLAEKYEHVQKTSQSRLPPGDDVVQDLNKQFTTMDIHEPAHMDRSSQSLTNNNRHMRRKSKEHMNKEQIWTKYRGGDVGIDLDNDELDDLEEVDFIEEEIRPAVETGHETTLDKSSDSSLGDLCSTFSSLRLSDHSSISVVSGSGEGSRNDPTSVGRSDSSKSELSSSVPDDVFSSPELSNSSPGLPLHPPDCRLYIVGDKPTRRDMDVHRALSHIDISEDFPHVRKWREQIDDISDELRSKWPTPRRGLRHSTSNPLLSTPIIHNMSRTSTFSPLNMRNLSPLQLHRRSTPDRSLWSPRIPDHSSPPVTRLFSG